MDENGRNTHLKSPPLVNGESSELANGFLRAGAAEAESEGHRLIKL